VGSRDGDLRRTLTHLKPSKHPKSITKKGIAARLAENQNLNRAVANRFMDQLYKLARKELAQGRPFRLPHFGTFRYKGKKLEFAISKRLSNIDKGKQLAFAISKRISDIKTMDDEKHDGN